MAPVPSSRPDPNPDRLEGSKPPITETSLAAAPVPAPPASPPREDTPEGGGSSAGGLARLRGLVDSLLVADVFLVLAGALWFALAVVLHSQGVEGPLNLFQKLWQPLFTPAISLLMAAALLSGALGWWQRRGQP